MLEGYNHQQNALFERERKESVESITPRARGGGFGVHNRLKQYTATYENKVFRKLEDEPLPAASVGQTKKLEAPVVVAPTTDGGKLQVLGDDINWSRPNGAYIPPGGHRFVHMCYDYKSQLSSVHAMFCQTVDVTCTEDILRNPREIPRLSNYLLLCLVTRFTRRPRTFSS